MKLRRHAESPVLTPDASREWESGAVFNCGATVGNDGRVYLLYRAIPRGYVRKEGGGYDNYISSIGCAVSEDGVHFSRYDRPVIEPSEEYDRLGCEDPRVTRLEVDGKTTYLITYTALSEPAFSGRGNRVALVSTEDFRTFHKHGVVIPGLEDKDAVIFPELVGGRVAMLHRVEPSIQIVYFDSLEQMIEASEEFWDSYRARLDDFVVMEPKFEWEAAKIGAGAPPIRTNDGWLLIYHGVDSRHIYRAGAALLDLDDPTRVIARLPYPILEPEAEYELFGDVNNVVFPEGAVVLDGTLYVYYGGADKVCGLATVEMDELLSALREQAAK